MKSICLFCIGILWMSVAYSQSAVILNIHHKIGASNFAFNQTTSNDLGDPFQFTRVQYYLSKFSIVHDGGQELEIDYDTVALVNANEFTAIPLGDLSITDVEAIKFYVGVHNHDNHLDPSTYPSYHPLAHQSPSMHWGWADGYRFIALEGVSGSGLNQAVEIHTLGDANYFQTYVPASSHHLGGEIHINIEADYTKAFTSIPLSSGLINHGNFTEAKTVAENFRDFVFSETNLVAKIDGLAIQHFEVYPVPSTGLVKIKKNAETSATHFKIINLFGEEVFQNDLNADELEVTLHENGIYILQFFDGNKLTATQKVVIAD